MGVYSHYNGKLGLICFAIYLIMLFVGRRTFSGKIEQSISYWLVFFFMALYSVLGFLEWDTYHYYGHYEEMFLFNTRIHVEQFFFWLVKVLPHSYILFRLVIWGTASWLMAQSAKMLNLNANVFCFMVPLLFITQLSVTRGALGLSLMIFCSILFIQSLDKRKLLWIIVAVLGLFYSPFLHKSIILYLFLLVFAYFFPFNKKTFVVSLLVFPLLYMFALSFFQKFSFFDYFNADQIYLVSKYQETEKITSNINGIIQKFFESTIYLLLLFDMTKKFLYEKIKVTKEQFFMYKYAYIMVYVYFLFFGQNISNWVSNRTLHAASFALVLCATQCYDTIMIKKERSSVEKIILIGFIIMTVWKQFAFIYKNW